MRFEWDEAKNRANIRKHGFDFAEAEEMFRGVLLVRPDTPRSDGLGSASFGGGLPLSRSLSSRKMPFASSR